MKMLTAIGMKLGTTARVGLLASLASLGLLQSPHAIADTMLLASTDLVTGTSAATFSFQAPSAGTVTAEISSLAWPVPLSALSFSADNASTVLAHWSGDASTMTTPYVDSFQVGSGTYFAHVNATAGGSLNLGLYSLLLTFAPSAVPLSASSWMLVIGMLVLFGLMRTLRAFGPFETGEGAQPVEQR
jgi:hypothetical protein